LLRNAKSFFPIFLKALWPFPLLCALRFLVGRWLHHVPLGLLIPAWLSVFPIEPTFPSPTLQDLGPLSPSLVMVTLLAPHVAQMELPRLTTIFPFYSQWNLSTKLSPPPNFCHFILLGGQFFFTEPSFFFFFFLLKGLFFFSQQSSFSPPLILNPLRLPPSFGGRFFLFRRIRFFSCPPIVSVFFGQRGYLPPPF